jgi:hypothetical protein
MSSDDEPVGTGAVEEVEETTADEDIVKLVEGALDGVQELVSKAPQLEFMAKVCHSSVHSVGPSGRALV